MLTPTSAVATSSAPPSRHWMTEMTFRGVSWARRPPRCLAKLVEPGRALFDARIYVRGAGAERYVGGGGSRSHAIPGRLSFVPVIALVHGPAFIAPPVCCMSLRSSIVVPSSYSGTELDRGHIRSVTDQRFERADELSPGDQLLAATGQVCTVTGLNHASTRSAAAYNLAVDGIHSYHVGSGQVLVHNECPEFSTEVEAGPVCDAIIMKTSYNIHAFRVYAGRVARRVDLCGWVEV